jgi:hypothetical protein
MDGAIYIDDAGNPGAASGSDFLSGSRKSWTAVVVPSSIANDVSTAMTMFLAGVQQDFGADELHFTDIYSGRGVWESVEVARRLEIFDLMKMIVNKFALPIFHQTVSEETFLDNQVALSVYAKVPGSPWDIKDVSHFGFLILCSRMAKNLRDLSFSSPSDFVLPMPLFVDEGIGKAGTDIPLPNWGDVFDGQNARFRTSHEMAGIQIADFAAFAISRTQWIMVQQKLGTPIKRGDLEFLSLTAGFNSVDLPLVGFSPENISKEAYEFVLSQYRRANGLSLRPPKLK